MHMHTYSTDTYTEKRESLHNLYNQVSVDKAVQSYAG